MKKSILLASAFAVLSAGVMAEEFENRAYKARDMPAVQYDAIRSGLYSECDSKAQSIAKQGAQRPQNCEAYKQLYGSWEHDGLHGVPEGNGFQSNGQEGLRQRVHRMYGQRGLGT